MSDYEFQPFQRSQSSLRSFGFLAGYASLWLLAVVFMGAVFVLFPIGLAIKDENVTLAAALTVGGILLQPLGLYLYSLVRGYS